MTIAPMMKKCPKCHRKYSWNPDVGKMFCPYCHGLGKVGGGIFGKIFGSRKGASEDESDEDNTKSDK